MREKVPKKSLIIIIFIVFRLPVLENYVKAQQITSILFIFGLKF